MPKKCDLKNRENSALNFLITNFKNISKLGIVEFTKDDVVRHPLIKEIETIFENLEEEKLKNKKNVLPIIEKKSLFKRLFK